MSTLTAGLAGFPLMQTYAISASPQILHPIQSTTNLQTAKASAATPLQKCQNFPCGIWLINGFRYILTIPEVDEQGKIINGSLAGNPINNGFWDQVSKKLSFTQTIPRAVNNSLTYQFTGFLHNLCNLLGKGVEPCDAIAGSAIPIGLPAQEAAREEFGWLALYNGPRSTTPSSANALAIPQGAPLLPSTTLSP